MSEINRIVAEMRLVQNQEDNNLSVDTAIMVDNVVGPEELIAMFGHGVWDLLKKSQWTESALAAKSKGISDDEWTTFESNMDFIIAGELHQYLMSVLGALMLPETWAKDGAIERFREALEWTTEYVERTTAEAKVAKEQFEADLNKEE